MAVNPGDVIGEMECPCCGNPLPIKLNKNKTAYVYCTAIVMPETRERCGFKSSFGRSKSKTMIKEYEENNNVRQTEDRPAIEPEGNQPGGDEIREQPAIAAAIEQPKRGGVTSWFDSL